MTRKRLPAITVLFTSLLLGCENQPNPTSSAPATGSKSFKETMKEEAGKVADAAKEGATNIAAGAKEVAHAAADEAKDIAATAREAAGNVSRAARAFMRSTKDETVVAAEKAVDEARVQLEVLKQRKDEIQESVRPEYDRAVAELSDRVEALKERYRELKGAAPDVWRATGERLAPILAEFRAKVDTAWNEYVRGGAVRGSVLYLERMLLPEDAELRIRLLDTSRSDPQGEVLAEQTQRLSGPPPFAFELRFDPSRIHPKGTYAISAEIVYEGKRQFATPGPKRVSIGESSANVEVLVRRAE